LKWKVSVEGREERGKFKMENGKLRLEAEKKEDRRERDLIWEEKPET